MANTCRKNNKSSFFPTFKIFPAPPKRKVFIYNFFLFFLDITGKGLTQLDVSQNQLQNVPSSALKNLHHLLILNLNHNKISVIHNRAFEGLDTLEILTLYENRMTGIEPEAFRGLDK